MADRYEGPVGGQPVIWLSDNLSTWQVARYAQGKPVEGLRQRVEEHLRLGAKGWRPGLAAWTIDANALLAEQPGRWVRLGDGGAPFRDATRFDQEWIPGWPQWRRTTQDAGTPVRPADSKPGPFPPPVENALIQLVELLGSDNPATADAAALKLAFLIGRARPAPNPQIPGAFRVRLSDSSLGHFKTKQEAEAYISQQVGGGLQYAAFGVEDFGNAGGFTVLAQCVARSPNGQTDRHRLLKVLAGPTNWHASPHSLPFADEPSPDTPNTDADNLELAALWQTSGLALELMKGFVGGHSNELVRLDGNRTWPSTPGAQEVFDYLTSQDIKWERTRTWLTGISDCFPMGSAAATQQLGHIVRRAGNRTRLPNFELIELLRISRERAGLFTTSPLSNSERNLVQALIDTAHIKEPWADYWDRRVWDEVLDMVRRTEPPWYAPPHEACAGTPVAIVVPEHLDEDSRTVYLWRSWAASPVAANMVQRLVENRAHAVTEVGGAALISTLMDCGVGYLDALDRCAHKHHKADLRAHEGALRAFARTKKGFQSNSEVKALALWTKIFSGA